MNMNLDKKQMVNIAKGVTSGICLVISGVCFNKASYYRGKADAFKECEELLNPLKKYTNNNK